jgi:hypothetical protein
MKTLTIKNQSKWDALPPRFEEFTVLEIRGEKSIVIKEIPKNSRAELWGDSRVELWGDSCAVLREKSRAVLWGDSRVELWENSHAELWENSHAELWGDSHAELGENSHAELWGDSSAILWGNSRAILRDNSHAELGGDSSAELRDKSRAVLWGDSSAILWGDSRAELRDKSRAVLWGNSSAVLWDKSRAVLWENSLAKVFSKESQITANHHSVVVLEGVVAQIHNGPDTHIIKREAFCHNIESFQQTYGLILTENGEVTLYKIVQDNFKDHWTGRISYKPGNTVTCPDWDPNPQRKCGGGLHLSATPQDARRYNGTGRLLLCAVKLEDIIVHPEDITKVRCRSVRVLKEIIDEFHLG